MNWVAVDGVAGDILWLSFLTRCSSPPQGIVRHIGRRAVWAMRSVGNTCVMPCRWDDMNAASCYAAKHYERRLEMPYGARRILFLSQSGAILRQPGYGFSEFSSKAFSMATRIFSSSPT